MGILKNVYSKDKSIDYEVILTSAVHDMKNSLCLLLQSIETMAADTATTSTLPTPNTRLADLYCQLPAPKGAGL